MDILIWLIFIIIIIAGVHKDSRLQCRKEEEYFADERKGENK